MVTDVLQEAIALIAAGKNAEAQQRLEPFIEANPHHIQAWLWEAKTWPTINSQIKVLELALKHNPDDRKLQEVLAILKAQPNKPTAPQTLSKSTAQPQRRQPNAVNRRLAATVLTVCVLAGLAGLGFWLVDYSANCGNSQHSVPALRILFIGNSYTMANDLPGLFVKLACAGGHKIETGMAAQGGWTLANHAASPQTLGELDPKKWDIVILQEQSLTPAVDYGRQQMYPAVRLLAGKISATGARTVLFMTWGRRDGWPEGGSPDFNTMQAQLSAGYLGIANELKLPVAPVGAAWLETRTRAPQLKLWQDDGSHPAAAGTYLAACVFYAVVFRQSPVGLSYTAGLSPETAQILQASAADTVLKEPRRWNLP